MAAQFLRKKIIDVARAEAQGGGVFMKQSVGPDASGRRPRQGWEKVLKYFRTSAPGAAGTTYFPEDAIKYLTTTGQLAPCPHWCGIFALYCYRAAGLNVGTWIQGSGISSVAGFRQIQPKSAQPGDVGYVSNGFEHHFIIEDIVMRNGSPVQAKTIEGNGDPSSNFNFKTRDLSSMLVYTMFT